MLRFSILILCLYIIGSAESNLILNLINNILRPRSPKPTCPPMVPMPDFNLAQVYSSFLANVFRLYFNSYEIILTKFLNLLKNFKAFFSVF